MTDAAPRDRDIAMVFQSYALYPHMSSRRTRAFALRMARGRKPAIADRVAGVGERLGIGDLLHRRPRQLSAASASASPTAGRSCATRPPS